MFNDTNTVALSIPIGFLCSFGVWWFIYRYLRPEIEISSKIILYDECSDKEENIYTIDIVNRGFRRAVDLDIVVRYRFKIKNGLYRNFDIPTTQSRCISLRQDKRRHLKFDPNEITNDPKYPDSFSERTKTTADKGLLDLETLLREPESDIQVYVFATDEFSGSRHLYSSKKYESRDIRPL